MSKITYANKVAINENAEIPDINKVTDNDMNEIKAVVNNNDDESTAINTKLTNATTYSTDEIRVGTWLNKPLYRKVITGNTGVLKNTPKYNISDNVNICTRFEGFITDGSNNLIPINYSNSGALVWAYITAERKLGIQSNVTYFDNCPLYVTLEYTKTTDV